MSTSVTAEIDDLRLPSAFKGTTFSGFKKTEVRKQFLKNMLCGKIEPACYWAAELICAGHTVDLWENIFHFFAKHIHLANVKIPIYVERRYRIFANIVDQKLYTDAIQLRNKSEIRRLFAEVISILTLSPRKPSFEPVRIQRKEEFDMTQMHDKLKADRNDYATTLFRSKDPREIYIPVNELMFELTGKNMVRVWYWIEWLIDFDVLCKRRTKLVPRDYAVENKYRGDLIWIVWDGLHGYMNNIGASTMVRKVMDSLQQLFCVQFTAGTPKKRRYLLYMATELLTETFPANIGEIVTEENKPVLTNVVEQIDNVYKQIKKSEQGSGMDYLFDGLSKESNFQQTIQKLAMMEGF
jgi:hypothetical protein